MTVFTWMFSLDSIFSHGVSFQCLEAPSLLCQTLVYSYAVSFGVNSLAAAIVLLSNAIVGLRIVEVETMLLLVSVFNLVVPLLFSLTGTDKTNLPNN